MLSADGRVIRVIDGGESHVNIAADLDRLFASSGANLTLVHNHPAGNGLSANDLSQLEKAGIATVVAVGHDGSIYAASRGDRFPAAFVAGFDGAVCGQARAGAERVLREERSSVLRSAFDAQVRYLVGLALGKAGILNYRFVLGADRAQQFDTARIFFAKARDKAVQASAR